jgi:uncharacterized protein (TIGR02145 family)
MLKGNRQVVYVMLITASFFYSCEKEVISNLLDIDGNEYKTITIGEQVWMAENLKVSHYRDGTEITNVTDKAAWEALTTEAYCIYNNNASSELDTYGALYNWYAVTNVHNIAPEGWHIPTDDEWKKLEMTLGMSQSEADDSDRYRGTDEGSKLAGNADLWNSGNLESNSGFGTSGFTALPSGARVYDSDRYSFVNYTGFFWSATELNSTNAWHRNVTYKNSDILRLNNDKRFGFAIRCVKD